MIIIHEMMHYVTARIYKLQIIKVKLGTGKKLFTINKLLSVPIDIYKTWLGGSVVLGGGGEYLIKHAEKVKWVCVAPLLIHIPLALLLMHDNIYIKMIGTINIMFIFLMMLSVGSDIRMFYYIKKGDYSLFKDDDELVGSQARDNATDYTAS